MANLTDEFLTTRDLAELLHIKERKVYDLVASGDIPHSRATGKLLFPRAAVNDWVAGKSSGPAASGNQSAAHRPNVFLGSHDPLLEWALRESGAGLATFFDGSGDGLKRFAGAEGIATGMHCYDPLDDSWNLSSVAQQFADNPVVLIEFAWRVRGLILPATNPLNIQTLADLRQRRVIPRQSGAGSQVLLDHLLQQENLQHGDCQLLDAARTETDAALTVLEGHADAAFGLQGVAAQLQLEFVPIMRERFDLLIDRRSWFEPALQSFSRFCHSDTFFAKAAALSGYDVSGFGTVHFNGN